MCEIRSCFHSQSAPDKQDFLPAGKAIFRSNPDGLQGKATQNAVKKAVQTVCNGYGNSFQVLRSFYENQRHSNGLCPL
jgi:hypothetical protein